MIIPATGVYAQYNPPRSDAFAKQVFAWMEIDVPNNILGNSVIGLITVGSATSLQRVDCSPDFTKYIGEKEAYEKGFIHKPIDHIPPR